ncbi:MAG TPA: protein-tyrosine-phosphatase [Stellaceae bacterium]|nr:protein-tyrosine-phosphatase [Stellaceae bacterium]
MSEDVLLPFRLTICGLDELAGHRAGGVTHVLSILDPDRPEPEAFRLYEPHRRLELRFHDIIDPAPGWVLPQREDVERLLVFGRDLAGLSTTAGAHLLVHCHAGISRSTAAAALLAVQARPGRPAAEAFSAIVAVRPRAWPNLRILELGDALLRRDGEIVAAAHDHYRRALADQPSLAALMSAGGRGREVNPPRG